MKEKDVEKEFLELMILSTILLAAALVIGILLGHYAQL